MKKFLSLILALTLVASLFTVNVMAASKAHTVTISADKTTELAAGDTVVITLAIDNTEALVSCSYDLTYDATAFTADTTKVSRLEKCIDSTWMSDIKNADGDWAYYLGNPTYNVATAGLIKFAWAGSEGVEHDYAVDNRVIGKFNLTVADGVADGEYTFSLTGKTMDAGENGETAMVCAPITVTVGSSAPAVVPPTVGGSAAVDTPYTNAFAVKAEITPGSATEIGVLFAPDVWLTAQGLTNDKLVYGLAGAAKATLTGDALGKGVITLKAAIRDIPRDVEGKAFKMVTRAYAANGADVTYADAVATDYTAFAE